MSNTAAKRAQEKFKNKITPALKEIAKADDAFKAEEWVAFCLETARWLVNEPADGISDDELQRVGATLSGVYAYFGNKSARARAERDVYEEKYKSLLAELTNEILHDDPKYKVTAAKGEALAEIDEAGIAVQVAVKEMEKNNWENIQDANDRMISFIQTILSFRKNERFKH